MLSDSQAAKLFKVLGYLHIIFALLTGCFLVLGVLALGAIGVANAELGAYGADPEPVATGLVIVGLLISAVSASLYVASAVGFLKMKKWQPVVFSVVVVFSVLDMIINLVTNGFQIMSFVSLVFLFVWGYSLWVTWSKKAMFAN